MKFWDASAIMPLLIAEASTQDLQTLTAKDATMAGAREGIARKTYIRATGFESPVFDQTLTRMKSDMPDRLVEILLEVA
jgi:hypothetical protein